MKFIGHLEERETLEKVLAHVGREGLRATSISLEPARLLNDTDVNQIMRAVDVADRLRVEVKWTSDVVALLPAFTPQHRTYFRTIFEMDLASHCALDDDSSLDLMLYFANSIMFRNFVIERYDSDVLALAKRVSKVRCTSVAPMSDTVQSLFQRRLA